MPVRSVILACLAVVAGSAAMAADSQEHEWRAACAHDAFVHCTMKALSGDRDGVRACLVKHIDKISARCRAVVEAAGPDSLATNDAGVQADDGAGRSPPNKIPKAN